MLKKIVPAIALMGLLSACSSLQDHSKADVDALLDVSGVNAQLNLLKQPLDPAATKGLGAFIPDDIISGVNGIVSQSFNSTEIEADFRAALNKRMSPAELRSARNFFESRVGQQVVLAENGKLTSSNIGLNEKRGQLETLDAATGTSALLLDVGEQSLGQLFDVITDKNCLGLVDLPMGGLLSGFAKKAQIQSVRQSLRKTLDSRYSGLSSGELDAYIKFAQSSAGQSYFQAREDALGKATKKAGDNVASLVTKETSKLCKK